MDNIDLKYGAVQQPASPPAQETVQTYQESIDLWRQSKPIMALHEYIRANRPKQFMVLVNNGGRPSLLFDPGINPKDPDRWAIAQEAVDLLVHAADDIDDLMAIDQLPLRPHPGYPFGSFLAPGA